MTEKLEVKYIRYMRSHNSGNIHGEICIFERSNEKNHFSRTKIYLDKKNYTTIIRTYWATKYESKVESKFGATYQKFFKFVRWMLTSSLKLIHSLEKYAAFSSFQFV